jgi:hypothetical protein
MQSQYASLSGEPIGNDMGVMGYPVIAALVTGPLALVGGYVGAALTRRTEYEKWLRQERSTVFAEFLRQLYETQKRAQDAIYSTEEIQIREIRVSEIFHDLTAHAGIVRLYLHPDDRTPFSACVKEFAVAHSPSFDQRTRFKKSESAFEHVQALFERTMGVRRNPRYKG